MVANAGGPVMSMYFIASRFPVKQFLGTSAWFFAIVNLTRAPFSLGLGLITGPSLLLDLVLVFSTTLGCTGSPTVDVTLYRARLGAWVAGIARHLREPPCGPA